MADQVTGTVERANGTGFKLAGGDWLNVSKYAQGVQMPEVGAAIVATLDKSGYVRKLERQGPEMTGEQLADYFSCSKPAETAPAPQSTQRPDRETAITRLACLNTATAILGGGPSSAIDAAEVVKLAGRLEVWVIRAG